MKMISKFRNCVSDIKDVLYYTFFSGRKTGDVRFKILNLLSGDILRPSIGCMCYNIKCIEEFMDEEYFPVMYDELGYKYINVSYVDMQLRHIKREIKYITGEES